MWEIYNTREACCNTNFAYSTYCDVKPESTGPTKHPTIAAPDDDQYEVIPIKFDVSGLPDSITMRDLKDEMAIVLKRILLRLAKSIPGLKISSVEEKVVLNRNLEMSLRALVKDVTLYFNVNVIRVDGKKFGPLIITEIRDSYDEVLDQVQTFSDTKYFGADLKLNWCTTQDGKFELCVKEIIKKPVPRPAPVSGGNRTPTIYTNVLTDPPLDKPGFPAWAIALIVVLILLLVCCIGYFIFASCARGNNETKEIENNIYMDDNNGGGSIYGRNKGNNDVYFIDEKSQQSRFDENRSRSSRSRQSRQSRQSRRVRRIEEENADEVQIVLAEPQNPQFDDDSFTINTYGTKKTKRQGRDPTMYIPGQEDRPDPDDTLRLTYGDAESSSRRYLEDPPLKPKRDPTMYVDGQQDASVYDGRDYGAEDPPLKPKRDPTMYVDGQQDASTYDPSVAEFSMGRGSYENSYGMGGIEDESDVYDNYGVHSEVDAEYMTSETNAESVQNSFRTQDASVAQSARGKKSRKNKKSSRSPR